MYSVNLVLSFAKLFVRLLLLYEAVVALNSLKLPSTFSEDVFSFAVDIASIVKRGGVHHGLPIGDTLPDASGNILTILNCVLFHLLNVSLFGGAISSANALVVAGV